MSIIKCPACGKDVSSEAAACPNCGHPIMQVNSVPVTAAAEKPKKKKHGCLIALICVIAVVAIGVAAAPSGGKTAGETASPAGTSDTSGDAAGTSDAANTEQTDASAEPEYISVTSTELIDAFNSNQVACKQAYDGKLLAVTGTVESVGTDLLDQTYVSLGSDTEYTIVGVQCFAKDKEQIDKIAALSKGQTITVYGKADCSSLAFYLQNSTIG